MTAVEFITVLLITLVLIIASFVAGLKLAGYYNKTASAAKEYALQKQYVRLIAHADADDPVAPYVSREPLPPEFETRLRATGRATASLTPNRNSSRAQNSSVPTG